MEQPNDEKIPQVESLVDEPVTIQEQNSLPQELLRRSIRERRFAISDDYVTFVMVSYKVAHRFSRFSDLVCHCLLPTFLDETLEERGYATLPVFVAPTDDHETLEAGLKQCVPSVCKLSSRFNGSLITVRNCNQAPIVP
ncbi:hypothetical protein V2J09_022459 [Rumex salicifolius]